MSRAVATLFAILLLSGCAPKEPMVQQSRFIVLKTPVVRYADMGFVSQFETSINVQIYASGQSLASLDIYKESICMSSFECMSKEAFYKKVFLKEYPKDMIDSIFLGEPIFDGKNVVKGSDGFTQQITEDNRYDITYSVAKQNIDFHDKINNIIIKVQVR